MRFELDAAILFAPACELVSKAHGVHPREAVIGEVMDDGLATVSPSTGMHQAIHAMRANDVRRAAVLRLLLRPRR